MKRHFIIPDTQVSPGHPIDHMTWIGLAIEEYRPDVVIHLGDHWVPAAFQPLPKPGEPFDAYEGELSMQARKTALNELIAESQRLGLYDLPPNCDGNRQFADASAVLAHAQHEAALDGEGCDSVACSITRGVND